jgi:hypothetical protein
MNIALWIAQALLAAIFLFAGGMKLVVPIEDDEADADTVAGWFPPFHGIVEVLARSDNLPWLPRSALTPLVATAGDSRRRTVQLAAVRVAPIPLVVGILAAFVAYGRWRLTPPSTRS